MGGFDLIVGMGFWVVSGAGIRFFFRRSILGFFLFWFFVIFSLFFSVDGSCSSRRFELFRF